MAGIEARFRVDWPGFALDVDITLPGRGVSALFGQSGSGKTTLLRCIAGLERAPRGRLVVDGEVWQDDQTFLPTYRRPLGYVFQEASLFAHLSVLGNLRYGMKRSSSAQQVSLDHAIELLGIGQLLQRQPERLSGGERQRVAIARALAVGPRLLLMDEPLASLDTKRKQEIFPYLERLHHELKIPLLYVSHSPDEVARLADHLVAMDAGRVVVDGPLASTLTRLDVPLRLGEDIGAVVEATIGAKDSEWNLVRVDFAGGSLWAPDPGMPLGGRVRLRVLARDVSLATQPTQSSIQNVLQGHVEAIGEDQHPGLTLVRVRVGETALLARLTRRAAAALEVQPGLEIWAQIKSVALME